MKLMRKKDYLVETSNMLIYLYLCTYFFPENAIGRLLLMAYACLCLLELNHVLKTGPFDIYIYIIHTTRFSNRDNQYLILLRLIIPRAIHLACYSYEGNGVQCQSM